jgi:FlaA1/EpsC-like NDP-sugar epimerase
MSRLLQTSEKLFSLPRRLKQGILIAFDVAAIPLSLYLAVLVRRGEFIWDISAREALAIAITVVASAIIFVRLGLYRAVVRYMGQQAILTVLKGVSWSTVILTITLFAARSEIPRSVPWIYWALAVLLIGGSRLLVRASYQSLFRWTGRKVAIYGAGSTGHQLMQSLILSGEFAPMIFLDDDRSLHGTVINGIPVYDPAEFGELQQQFDIACVLLAMPTVERARRKRIIETLEHYPVQVKTVPSFVALVSGQARIDQLRDVDVEDLLGRDPVPPQQELITRCVADKTIAVTGAGGSIGSELSRQALYCAPRVLLLIEQSEHALYSVHRDLQEAMLERKLNTRLVPLIANVQNEERMQHIFASYGVCTVYHAAAYKHVPMVEGNVIEGVANNVLGTLAVARAAALAGVESFVLISTDKAVRPTNVMGATKRVAELVVQALAEKYADTRFCAVRFGNVLGSSGSVVPLFREQIASGGPVTVTHADVQRFFMTTAEAAQLVLQAGAMGDRGDVFVLDMGEPVRIVELARRMIRLMGYSVRDEQDPTGEIEIVFVGLRPGEKLVEELLLGDRVTGTVHPKIFRAQEAHLPEQELDKRLQQLRQSLEAGALPQIFACLSELVDGFSRGADIWDAVWLQLQREAGGTAASNVVPLQSPRDGKGQLPAH